MILLAFTGSWLSSALVTSLVALALILVTLIEVFFLVYKRAEPDEKKKISPADQEKISGSQIS